jgi:hypothetical protein
MAGKPFPCRVGLHSFVREHPTDERPNEPRGEVCRRCGKRRGAPEVPMGLLGS